MIAPARAGVDERRLTLWQDQVQTQVLVAGSGPPLVFFHGPWGLAWDAFLDALAERFTVYAPHHPGTTPGDPDGVRALDTVWDLVLYSYELFDALGLEAPVVVGHSFGGMVAAEVAATAPGRVRRLVLISPLGLWRDDAPVRNWMALKPDALAAAAFADPRGPLVAQVLGGASDEGVDERIRRTWALACSGKFTWPIPDRGLSKRLHRVSAPTLIVWGRQDGLAPPIYAEEFAQRIRGARAEVVDGAAHHPHLERLDPVAPLVANFLAG